MVAWRANTAVSATVENGNGLCLGPPREASGRGWPGLNADQLTRVHDAVGVEGALHPAHHWRKGRSDSSHVTSPWLWTIRSVPSGRTTRYSMS
jgi:hypothetical protein